jgi:hypothetical protein
MSLFNIIDFTRLNNDYIIKSINNKGCDGNKHFNDNKGSDGNNGGDGNKGGDGNNGIGCNKGGDGNK